MNADGDRPEPEENDESQQDENKQQQVRADHLSARIPEAVGRGVFSTGAIVMTGPNEFVLDFIQRAGRPHQVVARVIVPHQSMGPMVQALANNIELYTNRFGPPPELPKPPKPERMPSIQEIYDDLKLPDEILSGSYANGLMIGHTPSEFSLDFLTNFFPNSAVSCRVYLSVPQVCRLLDTLRGTHQQHLKNMEKRQQQEFEQDHPQYPPEGELPDDIGHTDHPDPDEDE